MRFLPMVIALLSLCPAATASYNEARFAAAGYRRAVMQRLIKPDSPYSLVLQQALFLLQQGATIHSAAEQTGLKPVVLLRLVQMGAPVPTIEAVTPDALTKPELKAPPEPIRGNTKPEVNNAPKNAYKAK